MTEKRFTVEKSKYSDLWEFHENGLIMGYIEVADKLNELSDENEQLKQRNNRQAKQLDRLYCLIEEKDWRALNDILDDFKKCDEQLQKEWGTYGDGND